MSNMPVPSLAQPVVGFPISQSYLTSQVYNPLYFLLNPPIFYGVQAAVQTFATSANYAVTFDTNVVDSYGGHSTTTNNTRYTAQVSGWYQLSGCVGYAANGTGFRSAKIAVNGTSVQGGATEVAASSGSYATTVPTPVVLKYLSTGDYVEVWAWQTSGGNLTTTAFGDQACSMTVRYVHS